jgi:branched-chain amino acid transport system ATP-binding protein
MPEYAHVVAGELPYGHQRRVEIMRAMVRRASVIVLDEPCAGMNDAEAEALGKIFRALAHDGLAVLLIEHNVRLVLDICEDIYVLASGEVIAHGGPSEIRRSPKVIEVYLGSGHA